MIDKLNDPTATILNQEEIENVSISYNFAVERFQSRWEQRFPFTGTSNKLGSKSRYSFVNSTNHSVGNISTIQEYTDSEQRQKGHLQNLLTTYEKPTIAITKPEIDFSLNPGDKLEFNDNEKLLSCDMVIRSISFDFASEKNSFHWRR